MRGRSTGRRAVAWAAAGVVLTAATIAGCSKSDEPPTVTNGSAPLPPPATGTAPGTEVSGTSSSTSSSVKGTTTTSKTSGTSSTTKASTTTTTAKGGADTSTTAEATSTSEATTTEDPAATGTISGTVCTTDNMSGSHTCEPGGTFKLNGPSGQLVDGALGGNFSITVVVGTYTVGRPTNAVVCTSSPATIVVTAGNDTDVTVSCTLN